jgi:hypothetical protein
MQNLTLPSGATPSALPITIRLTILRRQRFAGCSFEWAADPAASSAQFVSCEGGLDDPDNDLSPAG